MPNLPISGLPAAGVLVGTEPFPVVQGGTTKQSTPNALKTFIGALSSINADVTPAQLLSAGAAGTDFAIVDAGGGSHVFNLPVASAANTGKLSNTDWTTFNNKLSVANLVTVTLATASGAVAATTSNSAGITFNIPISGVDATTHTFQWQIAGSNVLQLTAQGNGGGGANNYLAQFGSDVIAGFNLTVGSNLAVTGTSILTGNLTALANQAFNASGILGINNGQNRLVDFRQTVTDVATGYNLWNAVYTLNPTADNPNTINGFLMELDLGSTHNYTGVITGFQSAVNFTGSGNAAVNPIYGSHYGVNMLGNGHLNALFGSFVEVYQQGNGTVDIQRGAQWISQTLTGTGTITDNVGFQVITGVNHAGSHIVTDKSIFIAQPGHTGTMDTHFGLYMETQAFGTNSWSLYTNEGRVYHKGFVGIGTSDSPTSNLLITQAATVGGTPQAFTLVAGAHTNLASTVSCNDMYFNCSRAIQWATGDLQSQFQIFFDTAPTINFVGASTAGVAIGTLFQGAPEAGTNCTILYSASVAINAHEGNGTNNTALLLLPDNIANGKGNVTSQGILSILNIVGDVSLGNQTATLGTLSSFYSDIQNYVSDTNTRTVTNAATVIIAGAPTAGTNVVFTNPANALWVQSGGAMFDGRLLPNEGASIAAANNLTLGLDGNTFLITGNTTINAITTAGWRKGAFVILIFAGTPTVNNNTAGGAGTAKLLLQNSSALTAAANTVLMLVYDGTNWQQVAPVKNA